MKENALTRDLFGRPWAIMPSKLEAISEMVLRHCEGVTLSADTPQTKTVGNAVAVLPLFGTIHRHCGLLTQASGGTSTASFGAAFDQMVSDPKIGTIVMQVNSPGGSVYGVEELAAKIYSARDSKRIIASVDPLAASAALWIATAAQEVYVTPSGEMGSIGVLSMHTDFSAAEEAAGIKTTLIATPPKKVLGNEFEPLSQEAIDEIQAGHQVYYDQFVKDVARNRGVTKSVVENQYGGGGMLLAKQAVDAGLADGLMDFDAVMAMVLSGKKASARGRGNRNRMKAMLQTIDN